MNLTSLLVLGVGLLAGVLSGMFGIGGGVIIVIALTALGLDQKTATGTSLAAMIPPVGLLAVMEYHGREQVHPFFAVLIAAGILVGALVGAKITGSMSPLLMKKLFGVLLVFLGARYLMSS